MAGREQLNSQEWAIRFEREERERATQSEQERLLDSVSELLERGEIDPNSASAERLSRALESHGGGP